MITFNPEIIKVPAFMTKFTDIDNLSFLKKINLIIKGKLTSYVLSNFKNKNICKYFNLFFRFDGQLVYENKYFVKKNNDQNLYYPNTRFTRTIINQNKFLDYLFSSYLLDKINFQNDDLIVDCGANVGELALAFNQKKIHINYIGIEPEPDTFYCLNKNSETDNLNICLSDTEKDLEFFVDSIGANSSIIQSETTNNILRIPSKRLDTIFTNKKIKLLKIDAEGAEPEVLRGCSKIINNIDFISVDCGAERGMNQTTTFQEVFEILTKYNFEIVDIYQQRLTVLFTNKK